MVNVNKKIKFLLIDSYDYNINKYVLTFSILWQDMEWRKNSQFIHECGTVNTTAYPFIYSDKIIYIMGSVKTDKNTNSVSRSFDDYGILQQYKTNYIKLLKEWSRDE